MEKKIHLIGDVTKTICGRDLDCVEYVLKIPEGATCETCMKNAMDFQLGQP